MVKLNFDVKTHILKNGLEVITIKKNTQISSINIGIKVGALNESLEEKGISHYIEHMIFKGTKNRTFQKLNDELEALGGEYNAFTDYSQTVYSISCLEEELKNAIELLSDMLINSEFPEEEIDKETNKGGWDMLQPAYPIRLIRLHQAPAAPAEPGSNRRSAVFPIHQSRRAALKTIPGPSRSAAGREEPLRQLR